MFTAQELMDLKTAFEAVSMGEAFVNLESLKALFGDMQIYPTDDQLIELLETCGKKDEEDFISFELFARSVALLLEENADKVSTSSQADREQQQYLDGESENQIPESQEGDPYGQEGEEPHDDPYYNEAVYDQMQQE